MRTVLWRTLPALAIVLAAAIVVGIQAAGRAVVIGSDTTFHFSRVYDTYMQLRQGPMSWFQTNYGFQQSGRVVNALYGPLFAYLMGAVLLACGTWFRFQLAMDFLAYVVAGAGMYLLAWRAQEASSGAGGDRLAGSRSAASRSSRIVATCIAVAYMNLGWVARWQTSTNMTAWGAILAPYVCLVCLRMVCPRTRGGRREARVSAVTLAAAVSVMAQVHLLSCAMSLAAIVPFWILGMVRADGGRERVRMLLSTLGAVAIALVLTGDVWAGLLEVSLKNRMASPVAMALEDGVLWPSWGLEGKATVNWLVLALLVAGVVWAVRRRDPAALPLGLVGAAFLLLASPLVPWAQIGDAVPALEHTFQFPVRFLVVAYPLLYACLAVAAGSVADTMTEDGEDDAAAGRPSAGQAGRPAPRLALACVALLAVAALAANSASVCQACDVFWSQLTTNEHIIRLSSAPDEEVRRACLDADPGELTRLIAKRSPDYLPNHNPSSAKGLSSAYERGILGAYREGRFSREVLPDGALRITWEQPSAGRTSVPVITYAESRLTLNGASASPRVSRIGIPRVSGRAGTNVLEVRFVAPRATSAVIGVSVGSWAVLLVGAIISRLVTFLRAGRIPAAQTRA